MRNSMRLRPITLALAGVVLTTSLARAQMRGTISIDGSSTVYPITEGVAEEFSKKHDGVKVTVGISGTGGGFKRFVKGETDVSDASRPIKKEEADAAKANGVEYVELPIAYDGLSVVVNKSNSFLDKLAVDDMKKLFLDGGIKSWRELDPSFPRPADQDLLARHRFGHVRLHEGSRHARRAEREDPRRHAGVGGRQRPGQRRRGRGRARSATSAAPTTSRTRPSSARFRSSTRAARPSRRRPSRSATARTTR